MYRKIVLDRQMRQDSAAEPLKRGTRIHRFIERNAKVSHNAHYVAFFVYLHRNSAGLSTQSGTMGKRLRILQVENLTDTVKDIKPGLAIDHDRVRIVLMFAWTAIVSNL